MSTPLVNPDEGLQTAPSSVDDEVTGVDPLGLKLPFDDLPLVIVPDLRDQGRPCSQAGHCDQSGRYRSTPLEPEVNGIYLPIEPGIG